MNRLYFIYRYIDIPEHISQAGELRRYHMKFKKIIAAVTAALVLTMSVTAAGEKGGGYQAQGYEIERQVY